MDKQLAKDTAMTIADIEQYYVEEIETRPGEYILLDDLLNPISKIIFFPDGVMVTDEAYGLEPLDLKLNGEVRELIKARLVEKSKEELPRPQDYIPFF